jgi:hypothetical protein
VCGLDGHSENVEKNALDTRPHKQKVAKNKHDGKAIPYQVFGRE